MRLVSVIIPAYNASKFLDGAIRSVLQQSLQDFELVVVDDGSQDDTAQVVKPYLADPRVRYLFQANRGLPGARNAGAKASSGQYLTFLDADDFLATDALEVMLQAFRSSQASWLNVGLLKIDGDRRTIREPSVPSGDLFLEILRNDFITRSPFYPRQDFFEIGMYDEEIRIREDWDLNIRMIAAGKPFALVSQPLYHYTRTSGSITTGNRRHFYIYTEKLLRKHHKHAADSGNREAGRIYAKNMWDMARSYFYEIGDRGEAFRCAWESLRYDASLRRLMHPLFQWDWYGLWLKAKRTI